MLFRSSSHYFSVEIDRIHPYNNKLRLFRSVNGAFSLYGKPPPPPCSPRWLLQEVGSFGLSLEQLLCMCMQRTCMFHPNTILIKKAHHTEDTQISHSTNTDKTSRPTDCRRFRVPSIPPSRRVPIDTFVPSVHSCSLRRWGTGSPRIKSLRKHKKRQQV